MSSMTALKDNVQMSRMAGYLLFFLFLLSCHVLSVSAQDSGEIGAIPFDVVAILEQNELGEPIGSPSYLMFDSSMDEIYVQSGGKIVVFGADYYPYVSLGKGRGAVNAQGMAIDRHGMLYLCQQSSEDKPPRITVFNGAFFQVREIFFKGFDGAEDFEPKRVAVSQDGLIYVSSIRVPGVVVLNQQGEFLRWMKPMGKYSARVLQEARKAKADKEKQNNGDREGEGAEVEGGEIEPAADDPILGLPAGLIPKKKIVEEEKTVDGQLPVLIVDIDIDQEGHIYLLSESESKIYVYSANEEFLYSFGTKGGSSGKLSRPRGLAVDEKKKCVYVIDYMRQTLVIYDLVGKYLQEFGGAGWGPGWFKYPTDVALNRKGDVIISDFFNHRIQVLNLQFQSRFPLFGSQSEFPEAGETMDTEPTNTEAVVKPESSQIQVQPGEGGRSGAVELLPVEEEPLPEPISPPTAAEEESLSATGDNATGPDVPLPDLNSGMGISEEPIGAMPDDMR